MSKVEKINKIIGFRIAFFILISGMFYWLYNIGNRVSPSVGIGEFIRTELYLGVVFMIVITIAFYFIIVEAEEP